MVCTERSHILAGTRLRGPPDLVVEVLSSSSRRGDRKQKLALHEQAGVPDYWVVDPDARWIEQWVLQNGHYRRHARCARAIAMATLPNVPLDLAWVWQLKDAPPPQ